MLHTTTLARIRACRPCSDGWSKLLVGCGFSNGNYYADYVVTLGDIASTNNEQDALWSIRAFDINDDFREKLNTLLQRFVNRALDAVAAAAYDARAAYAAATARHAAAAADAADVERELQRKDIIDIFGKTL